MNKWPDDVVNRFKCWWDNRETRCGETHVNCRDCPFHVPGYSKCTQDDCDGTDGCYAYQVERAKLLGLPAPEKPNRGPYKRKEAPLILTSFKEQEVVVAHAKTPVTATHTTKEQQELGLITAAIEALDAALEVIPNDHWVSAFIDAPEQLRRYRSEAYGHMVDWKAIAGGGLTPPTRGGV